jgi:hypothetical protein
VQPATASHVGGINFLEKPRRIGCKPKFPCKICKGDHLTHLCPDIPEVQRLWSLSASPFDSESSEVSSQHIQPLVEKVVTPMQSSDDPTPLLRGEVPLDLVVSHPIHPLVEKVVTPMQSSDDPTPLLRGEVPLDLVVSQPMQPLVEKVVTLMQSLADPTPLLRGEVPLDHVVSQPMQPLVEKVVRSTQSSADPTPLLGSEVSTDYVFSISSSVLSKQGCILLIPSTPPPSPRMVSFDWNDLFEPRLPSYAPFQIRVEVNSTNIYRCIVDDGASASILSSSVWKFLGSPELVSSSHELLAFDRCPSEYLGILPQLPISLGRNIFLVDVIVVQGPLDFNMLLGRDYVYAMNVVVSTLFWMMHFPHNGSIVTINQLASDNHHPNSTLFQATPLYVPSVHVGSTPP